MRAHDTRRAEGGSGNTTPHDVSSAYDHALLQRRRRALLGARPRAPGVLAFEAV